MTTGSMLERVSPVIERYGNTADNVFVELLKKVKTALMTSDLDRVPAELIRPYPNQPRKYFNPVTITNMANSIDVTAQIQPGMIRRLKGVPAGSVAYEIIDGERRWRGIMQIPQDRRPRYKAEIIDADDEVVQFLIAGMANFNREGHTPLETADTIRRYHLEFKIPMEAVADLLGITAGWAYNILSLLNLPEPVKDMLAPEIPKKEQLQLIAAIQIAKLNNPKKQVELALRVKSGAVTLANLRDEVLSVAQATATPIRLREISPMKKWQGRQPKIEAVLGFATKLDELLTEVEIQNIMGAHPAETAALLKQIRQGIGKLNRCETNILKAQKARA